MWSWLIGMSQDGKAYADAALYLFTFLGLALVPSRFGRKAWWILAWFAAVNAIRLAFPPPGEPQSRTLAALGWALGQGPWLAFLFTMALRPGVRAFIAAVPVRQILLWHAFRLMGVHLGIAALTGVFGDEDAQRIALQGGFGETLTGLAALGLYCVYDPESQRMRAAALFWNTYGATSIFVLNAKTWLCDPNLPFGRPSSDLFDYVTSFPQVWYTWFWTPLALAAHLAVFAKFLSARRQGWLRVAEA